MITIKKKFQKKKVNKKENKTNHGNNTKGIKEKIMLEWKKH